MVSNNNTLDYNSTIDTKNPIVLFYMHTVFVNMYNVHAYYIE